MVGLIRNSENITDKFVIFSLYLLLGIEHRALKIQDNTKKKLFIYIA